MENKYLTVTALNKYIGYKFDTDANLQNVEVKGEISNIRISNNHLYFSLKDEQSEIRAIMFASSARTLTFMPTDGMKVIVTATVSVYQKGGTYNLNVRKIEDAGLGDLYLRFLELKDKLEKEGLFAEDIKRKLPKFVQSVAVITSATGDAINDIVSTINKRFPLIKIYLYPALVQGVDAPNSLIKAMNKANNDGLAEVIIIGRGGGSFEDLSCFNDEALARTIRNSKIPVVSAVGHEADFTIADFVADMRAPTPTGAAVIVSPDQNVIAKDIYNKYIMLVQNFKKILENKYYEYERIITRHHFQNFGETIDLKVKELDRLVYNLNIHSPLKTIENSINKVDEYAERLKSVNIEEKIDEKIKYIDNRRSLINYYLNQKIKLFEFNLDGLTSKMEAINPLNLLKKGYVLTYQNDKLITSKKALNSKSNLVIKYHDGEIITKPIKEEN